MERIQTLSTQLISRGLRLIFLLTCALTFPWVSNASVAMLQLDENWQWECTVCDQTPSYENGGIQKKGRTMEVRFDLSNKIPTSAVKRIRGEWMNMTPTEVLSHDLAMWLEKLTLLHGEGHELVFQIQSKNDPLPYFGKLPLKSIEEFAKKAPQFHDTYVLEKILINNRNPLLGYRGIRQALAYATPKESIIQKAWNDQLIPTGTAIHPKSPYFSSDQAFYPYDPQKSQDLLKDLGWIKTKGKRWRQKDSRSLSFYILYPDLPEYKESTKILAKAWADVGVELKPLAIKPKRFVNRIQERNYQDLAMIGMRFHPHADLKDFFHSTSVPLISNDYSGFNLDAWTHSQVDKLSAKWQQELRFSRKRSLAARLQRLYSEEVPSIALGFRWMPEKQSLP